MAPPIQTPFEGGIDVIRIKNALVQGPTGFSKLHKVKATAPFSVKFAALPEMVLPF
jgi:hypothetical protein